MIVLVTGANGLVGRHIVDKLSTEGVSIVAQFQNTPLHSWYNEGIHLLKADLSNKNSSSLFSKISPDIIVHCAAKIPASAMDSIDAANINKEIDSEIYNFAFQRNIPVVFISSVIVYEASSEPYQENKILHPTSPYAIQKYQSESIFSSLSKPSVSFRISSPYGGYQKPSRNVLYKFIHNALKGEDLMVYGTGNRCQDFICATDISNAVWDVLKAWALGVELSGIYNVAYGTPISMSELAVLITEIVGRGNVIYSNGVETDKHDNIKIDISRAYDILGWQPSVGLATGIRKVIDSLRNAECY